MPRREKHKKNRREKKMPPMIPLRGILAIFFVLLAAYFLFFFDTFKIKKVIIVNSQNLFDEEIEENVNQNISSARFLIFPGNNIFLVNKSKIRNNLKKKFDCLERVDASRIFPNVLKVKVYEIEPRAFWQKSSDKIYLVDKNGVVYSEFNPQRRIEKNLPKIIDLSNRDVKISDNVLRPEQINFIYWLYDELPKNGMKIADFAIPGQLIDEIRVITEDGWQIYFNSQKDAGLQIEHLKIVLNGEIKERKKDLEYVDLRAETIVYYKFKSAGVNQKGF